MTNHPNRGKLSRNALELVATFSRGGISLDHQQQQAIGKICRAALTIKRCAEEACNGPYWAAHRNANPGEWEAWNDSLEKRREAYSRSIRQTMTKLAPQVQNVVIGGDPRGATVKLVMTGELARLHDDWGREGVCVPGS